MCSLTLSLLRVPWTLRHRSSSLALPSCQRSWEFRGPSVEGGPRNGPPGPAGCVVTMVYAAEEPMGLRTHRWPSHWQPRRSTLGTCSVASSSSPELVRVGPGPGVTSSLGHGHALPPAHRPPGRARRSVGAGARRRRPTKRIGSMAGARPTNLKATGTSILRLDGPVTRLCHGQSWGPGGLGRDSEVGVDGRPAWPQA